MEENARKISDLGRQLYDAVRVLGGPFRRPRRAAQVEPRGLQQRRRIARRQRPREGAQVQGTAGGQRRRGDSRRSSRSTACRACCRRPNSPTACRSKTSLISTTRWNACRCSRLAIRHKPRHIPPPVFVRHPRARRYVVSVREDGRVRVTLPRWGSMREARAFAGRLDAWIETQRRRLEEDRAKRARRLLIMLDPKSGAGEARTAAAAPRTGRGVRPRRVESQRSQSALALGIVFATRPHLPELAACQHATVGSRLRDDPRTDAPSPHGSLEEILEARRAGVSRLRVRAAMAACERPRTVIG